MNVDHSSRTFNASALFTMYRSSEIQATKIESKRQKPRYFLRSNLHGEIALLSGLLLKHNSGLRCCFSPPPPSPNSASAAFKGSNIRFGHTMTRPYRPLHHPADLQLSVPVKYLTSMSLYNKPFKTVQVTLTSPHPPLSQGSASGRNTRVHFAQTFPCPPYQL